MSTKIGVPEYSIFISAVLILHVLMAVTVILNNISRCVGLIAKTIFHIVMLDAQIVTNR
jgi:hypothetical protein